ncbi:MAG: hypothetical protein BIFFINMI_00729 [Phycisphaerae bacterium]|nr:hypothetical protein [Phycisphaerae bacterium]
MEQPSSRDVVVVNLISPSYSGSTWANILLGSHPQAMALCEVTTMVKLGRPICFIHGDGCPLWSRYDTTSTENPYLQIARISGKRLLVVNNGIDDLPQAGVPGLARKYVFLVRDGRATAASALRKWGSKNMLKAARWWKKSIRRKERMLGKLDPADVLQVCYERLNDDTPAQCKRICEFLGVPYEASMVEYWKPEHHPLDGNARLLKTLAEKRGETVAPDLEKAKPEGFEGRMIDMDFYRKADFANFQDERWRGEVTGWQMFVFRMVAGRLNRKYGYPSGMD